jgi:hypothetical protein
VSRLPRVISPIRPLFLRDGIEVALVSIELWPNHLVVRLAALPNHVTDSRQRQHEAELEQWGDRLHAVGSRPPGEPGARLLSPLSVVVEDDTGTTYTPRSSSAGGTGSEWHGDWYFVADVPPTIERLTVRVTSPEGATTSVPVDLAP